MLNRFRDFVKRLELPQEEDGDLVYRIIDNDLNAVEVTAAQYGIWRMQNDVAQRAVVGQGTVDNVVVRTTFSIMPEHREYKPFGTAAYDLPLYDPLTKYSQRYDTWAEAERGHRDILQRISRDSAAALAAEIKAESLAGTAGEVRLAISAGLPALFQVSVRSENEVTIQTPLLRADGTPVELRVLADDSGFVLTGDGGTSAGNFAPMPGEARAGQVGRLFTALDVSVESEVLVCRARDASQLAQTIVRLAQAIACLSLMSDDN